MLNRIKKDQSIALFLMFLVIALSRLYFVNNYAEPIPFWDQWDAEGDFLLRPWIEGTYKMSSLWDDHNEHRILPTRILSLVMYEMTGQWNNLIAARVNILLASLIPVLILVQILKNQELTKFRWLVIPVSVVQFAMPFSFENLLVGFQSQFYFLILFTLSALAIVAYRPVTTLNVAMAALLSLLSILTMASGLLTPLSVAIVLFLRIVISNKFIYKDLLLAFIFIGLSLAGYFTIPNMGANDGLKATTTAELFHAALYILSWPFVEMQWPAVCIWTPGLIAILIGLTRKSFSKTDLMMTGFFGWSLAQCMIIAYGRGHDLTIVSSRYTELLSLGLIANAWFAVRLAEKLPIIWFKPLPFLFFLVFFAGHHIRRKPDLLDIARVHRLSVIQTQHVKNYLQTGDTTWLVPHYHGELPYPSPTRLRQLLNEPTLRSILPHSITDGAKKRERR